MLKTRQFCKYDLMAYVPTAANEVGREFKKLRRQLQEKIFALS